MDDESIRLKSKLQRLEDVLEKQRWKQKEQLIKFEKKMDLLEQELEEKKFSANYNKEQVLKYQLILNNLVEGIYSMDADGNVLAVNEQAKVMLTEDEITPVLLKAVSTKADKHSCLTESIETENQVYLIIAKPLIDSDDKVVGAVASIRVGNI